MQKADDNRLKKLALLEELDTSAKLIRLGFGELQNLSIVNDFYFLPLQLLAQGFERLMKVYLCLGYLSKKGRYPTLKDIEGHDLMVLLGERILTEYFSTDNKTALIRDKAF